MALGAAHDIWQGYKLVQDIAKIRKNIVKTGVRYAGKKYGKGEVREKAAERLYQAYTQNQNAKKKILNREMIKIQKEAQRIILDNMTFELDDKDHRDLLNQLTTVTKKSLHEIVNIRLKNIILKAMGMLETSSQWHASQSEKRRMVETYLRQASYMAPELSIAEYLLVRQSHKKKSKPRYIPKRFKLDRQASPLSQADRYIEFSQQRAEQARYGWYKFAFLTASNAVGKGKPRKAPKNMRGVSKLPGSATPASGYSLHPSAEATIHPKFADKSVQLAVDRAIAIDAADMAIYIERKLTKDLNNAVNR